MSTLIYQPYSTADTVAAGKKLNHDDIAHRARELWFAQGCPEGCDVEIWLEAEAELQAIQQKRYRHPHLQLDGLSNAA